MRAIDRWLLPALLLATAATFAVSVTFPFTHWDDPRYVWQNPLVVHPLGQGWRELITTPALGYPQVLTVLSYAAQRAVFGMAPWSFHLVNVLLHVINVAQTYALARKLGLSHRVACAAAMLFALHPVVVEPVCWVTGRKDLLATSLLLLAARTMLRGDRDAPFPSMARWLLVSGIALLGMAAKPSVTVAALVFVLLAYAARPGWPRRSLALALLPLLVLGGLIVSAAGAAQSRSDVHARSVLDAVLDVVGALAVHASHFVWPENLVTIYARLEGDPSVPLMIATSLGLFIGVVGLLRLDRRSPVFVGFAIAVVTYAPMSNVLAVNRWTADSYLYLPLIGVSIGLAACLRALLDPRWHRVALGVVPAVGMALAANSLAQSTMWSTPLAMWRAETERYPTSPVGYTELARTLAAEGRAQDATGAYVALDERFPEVKWDYLERARARWNRGAIDRGRALLEEGVAAHDIRCATTYWSALLDESIPLASVTPARVGEAFDLILPGMEAQVDDPRVWSRSLEILESMQLRERAERVRSRRGGGIGAAPALRP